MNRRIFSYSIVLLVSALLLASCGKDTGPTDPIIPPGDTTSVDTLPGIGSDGKIADFYDQEPDADACSEGSLKQSERKKVLDYLNALRRLHRLAPVSYRNEDDAGTTKAALIIAANRTLSHTPAQTSRCWTQLGYDISSKSNIAYRQFPGSTLASSESFIDQWLSDASVKNAGHRRWLLDPFLKYISFSRVDRVADLVDLGITGAAARVSYDERQDLSASAVEYVAYPFHEYPSRLYNSSFDMSFSVLVDRKNFFANNKVDYSQAAIAITAEDGSMVSATGIYIDMQATGLGNCLLWRAAVKKNIRYTVRITNVKVDGVQKNYEYWFALRTSV